MIQFLQQMSNDRKKRVIHGYSIYNSLSLHVYLKFPIMTKDLKEWRKHINALECTENDRQRNEAIQKNFTNFSL